jgi:hypothetical protein
MSMKPPELKAVLWENVLSLMRHHWGAENLTRLAREASVSPGTASRIKAQQTSIGLEVVQAVADVWGIPPWVLLVPHLDPANPPTGYMSSAEAALYKRLREAAEALPPLKP